MCENSDDEPEESMELYVKFATGDIYFRYYRSATLRLKVVNDLSQIYFYCFIVGCQVPDSCKCDLSFDYISKDITNGILRATVDSDKKTEFKVNLRNNGLEPSHGIILDVTSTVLLNDLAQECKDDGHDEQV